MSKGKNKKEDLIARPLSDLDAGYLLSALKKFVDCEAYYPPIHPTPDDDPQFYWLTLLGEELAKNPEYVAYEAWYIGDDPDDWKIKINLKPRTSNMPLCALHYCRKLGFIHRNPDYSIISGPHLHIYRDGNIGYAISIGKMDSIYEIFEYFFRRYNIQEKVERGLL